MSVYQITAKTGENIASLLLDRDLERFDEFLFAGTQLNKWNPINLKLNLESGRKAESLIFNDALYVFDIGVNLVVNEKVKNILIVELKDQLEFLPVNIIESSETWYLINVINSIKSALNRDKSEFRTRRNGSKGALMRAVFSGQDIPADTIFTFPESPWNLLSRGNILKGLIEKNHLTGFEFIRCKIDNDPL